MAASDLNSADILAAGGATSLANRLIGAGDAAATFNALLNGPDTTAIVTQSAAQDASLTQSINLANRLRSSAIRSCGGELVTAFGTLVRAQIPASGYAYSRFETVITGQVVQFRLENAANVRFQILVDDKWVGSGQPGSVVPTAFTTADGLYVKIVIPTAGPHKVAIEREYQAGIDGFYLEPNQSAQKPNSYPRVLVVTDSYGQTFSPDNKGYNALNAFPALLGYELGWDVTQNTAGSTGYAYDSANFFGSPSRIAIVAASSWDAVINFGGINNAGKAATDPAQLTADALDTFRKQRAAAPRAVIIVCGPWAGGFVGANITLAEQCIKAAFDQWADANSVFVSLQDVTLAPPLMSGIGWRVIFTAPVAGVTSATLATAFAGNTGAYSLRFSDGTVKTGVAFTNGSTAVSWTGAVTASEVASVFTTDGTAPALVGPDRVHPYDRAAMKFLGQQAGRRIRAALSDKFA